MAAGVPPSRSVLRSFPPFLLDLREGRLWKGSEELRLRRKPSALLEYLTANPRRLVTQAELVEAVWGKITMSESLLRTHIRELRLVLGEGVVETVVGRGYRFLLDVDEREATSEGARQNRTAPSISLVGRNAEMDLLGEILNATLQHKRQVVLISGEPGIGKTTFVDAFLAQIAIPSGALVATGSCVEHFGTGEAYLPVLAALRAACAGPHTAFVISNLARHAPTWLMQMPGLVSDDQLPGLHLRVAGSSQGRMLRELAEALEVMSAERPVVLVLEDMQWTDESTTDLVAMLGARREPARVLVIATCRRAELAKVEGFPNIIAELAAHKQALTLALESLPETAWDEYLSLRFPENRFPSELARTLFQITGGNPLFSVAIVDDLEGRSMIRRVAGRWELAVSVAEVEGRRPDTVRQLIDIQLDHLTPIEQRVLEAASVVGATFTAGAVAHALDKEADEVDSVCEELANEGRFLRFLATESWPDGTIQSQYAFAHALYRHAALMRIPAATMRLWHRRAAECLESAYRDRPDDIAAELAAHFDEARAVDKAVRYYCLAGERVMRRFGRREALAHFARARELVARLVVSEESELTELTVLKQLGPAMIALQGFHEPQLMQIFERSAELARKLRDDCGIFAALLGLQRCHFLLGELREIERYELEISEVVERLGNPVARAEATVLSASARHFRGQFAEARQPLTEACEVLENARRDAVRVLSAPVVGLVRGHLVVIAWLSGAPDEALSLSKAMLSRAEALGDPFDLATALTIAALLHRWRREPEQTLVLARRALETSRDVGAPVWQGRAMSLYHWAAAVLEPASASKHFEELSTGLPETLKAGPYGRTAFVPCLIELCTQAGQPERALRELDDALAYVEVSDERAWSSELHRLRGQLLTAEPATAEQEFARARDIARSQGARSFELRASMSLVKVNPSGKERRSALAELRRSYDAFGEGFTTGDLVEAQQLLVGP